MNMEFIVRNAEELKSDGVEVLKTAFSMDVVRKALADQGKRDRLYNPVTTWLIFLGQTISPDHSCRSAIAQARAAGLLSPKASVHTGGYCQARDRLPESPLHDLACGLGEALMEAETSQERWHGRRVIVVDGSSVSLPDTPANQDAYPQSSRQTPGCGFPTMYLCGLMSLTSGAILDFEPGAGNGNELSLWRRLWRHMSPGDVVLGDGKYSSYADVAVLQDEGIDTVARLGKRKTDFREGKIICQGDHIVEWERPRKIPSWVGDHPLPERLRVREIHFRVDIPGFRSESITLVTTLLDSEKYPQGDIAGLFFERWQVELRLRDIKTVLGMDLLRTKTPQRARKELWMYLAAYNLLRTLMRSAAGKADVPVTRISFQGTRQRLLAVAQRNVPSRRFPRLYRNLIRDIASDINPYRPYRIEPRAIKRRKKQFDLLNQPREVLRQKLMGAA